MTYNSLTDPFSYDEREQAVFILRLVFVLTFDTAFICYEKLLALTARGKWPEGTKSVEENRKKGEKKGKIKKKRYWKGYMQQYDIKENNFRGRQARHRMRPVRTTSQTRHCKIRLSLYPRVLGNLYSCSLDFLPHWWEGEHTQIRMLQDPVVWTLICSMLVLPEVLKKKENKEKHAS